jgi:eukaryotic-like serine/threonine-protein kinase
MTPSQWEKVTGIFHLAVELEGDERQALLDRECNGEVEIRHEVESLLAAHAEAEDFIEKPAANITDLSSDNIPSLAGMTFGGYTIEKSIGRGGMGEVYLATDPRLGRKVALKKLPDEYAADPGLRRRFQNEARSAATLNHPNVATIYSVEEFEGKPFITMEYVDGKTLDAITPAAGLDLKLFLNLFIQLSGALRHAHERGITHRDIKPGNIMIGSDGVPKILDFGLAQTSAGTLSRPHITDDLTEPGQIMGTPSYMSPEQAEGKEVDHRSDIFSFGVVMYEALTGLRPFAGDSHAELVSNLLKTEPPAVGELRPEVPSLISRLVSRCLAKRRRDRLQNMQEIRTILSEARAMMRAGTSTLSFGRRLYGEYSSGNALWRVAAAIVVLLFSFAGWYFFPRDSAFPINFDNMSIRRLSQSQNVVYAHIAPDGRSVAYNTVENNEQRAMWIRRIDDRNALQVMQPLPVNYWGGLTFSPDGGQIYFVTAEPNARHGTLYRISSLGGQPRKLVEIVNDLGSLTPDGKRVIYVRYGEPTAILSANSEDGSDEKILRTAEGTNLFRDPHISPDGRHLFFIELERNDGIELWSLKRKDLSDQTESVIVPPQREKLNEIAFTSSSDALLLNAADPVSNVSQLFHVSLSNGTRSRITNDLNFYFGVSVDRGATRIVAAQRLNEKRIWAGPTDSPDQMRAVSPEANVFQTVVWTPDGRIAFDAYDNNRPHIWICEADGANCQQLTPNDTDDSQPAVSPDGRYIAFTSNRNGPDQVWRMNIDGSNQLLLADVAGSTSSPRFSSDGKYVLFPWVRSHHKVLGRVPIDGGTVTEEQLLSESHWAISPDGTQAAYSIWDEAAGRPKVAVRNLAEDQPFKILDFSPAFVFDWSSDSKALIYRERQAVERPGSTVLKWMIAEDKPQVLLRFDPDHVVDLAFSKDGKYMAAIRGRLISDAVLLEAKQKQ